MKIEIYKLLLELFHPHGKPINAPGIILFASNVLERSPGNHSPRICILTLKCQTHKIMKGMRLRSIELKNDLLDVEKEIGLNPYLSKDWQRVKSQLKQAIMKYSLYLICFLMMISSVAQVNKDDALESIDGVINELLAQLSIENGEKMDTAAIRNLFHSQANFIVSDSSHLESASLNDFLILLADPYYEQGYVEKEIHKIVNEYNGIAQVFQTFYGRHPEDGEERGINSYQLVYNNGRWWILNILWTIESKKTQIPEKYGGSEEVADK